MSFGCSRGTQRDPKEKQLRADEAVRILVLVLVVVLDSSLCRTL
jgi:hypothetical protein